MSWGFLWYSQEEDILDIKNIRMKNPLNRQSRALMVLFITIFYLLGLLSGIAGPLVMLTPVLLVYVGLKKWGTDQALAFLSPLAVYPILVSLMFRVLPTRMSTEVIFLVVGILSLMYCYAWKNAWKWIYDDVKNYLIGGLLIFATSFIAYGELALSCGNAGEKGTSDLLREACGLFEIPMSTHVSGTFSALPDIIITFSYAGPAFLAIALVLGYFIFKKS